VNAALFMVLVTHYLAACLGAAIGYLIGARLGRLAERERLFRLRIIDLRRRPEDLLARVRPELRWERQHRAGGN
jgi:membrane protein DedA with SNARE-associated domain